MHSDTASRVPSVFVHIVTFESDDSVLTGIEALLGQSGFETPETLTIQVTDNASRNGIAGRIRAAFGARVDVFENDRNIGFAGAHNQGAARFLSGTKTLFLIHNPDLRLEQGALRVLAQALAADTAAGSATPLMFRCGEHLEALSPQRVDAAGMYITPSIRHLDRGADCGDVPEFHRPGYVFGGSGACLLLKRDCVLDLLLDTPECNAALFGVFPELERGVEARKQLFDEAFFAYREDAELAWRAQRLGWRCLYQPEAIAYHRRRVTPERRVSLPPEINRAGVRNRFLLQLNHIGWPVNHKVLLLGIAVRNVIVCLGVLLREWSSLGALYEVVLLWRRARARARELNRRARVPLRETWKWFNNDPVLETCATKGKTS